MFFKIKSIYILFALISMGIGSLGLYTFKEVRRSKLFYFSTLLVYYSAMLEMYLICTRYLVSSKNIKNCLDTVDPFLDGYIGQIPLFAVMVFVFSILLAKYNQTFILTVMYPIKRNIVLSVVEFVLLLIINEVFLKITLYNFMLEVDFFIAIGCIVCKNLKKVVFE